MLGQAVLREAQSRSIQVLPTFRTRGKRFDAVSMPFADFAEDADLNSDDYLVNCVGWIPQKASESHEVNSFLAHRLNEGLVQEISEAKQRRGFEWIQIGTDCVFDGKQGGYSEIEPLSPSGLYGVSKSAGEVFTTNSIFVRCSIVGPDSNSSKGLYEWTMAQPRGMRIQGYTNHYWNGVTTRAFSKLVMGLVATKATGPLRAHWIPKDSTSKAELLGMFLRLNGDDSRRIVPVAHPETIDRTLSTTNPRQNSQLWKIAGYESVPSVELLIEEMVLGG